MLKYLVKKPLLPTLLLPALVFLMAALVQPAPAEMAEIGAPQLGGKPANYALAMTHVTPYAKVNIHLQDFIQPAQWVAQYPGDPIIDTLFKKHLVEAFYKHGPMVLDTNVDNVDYRVEGRCGGVWHCSELQLNLFDQQRNLLGTTYLKRAKMGYGDAALKMYAEQIAQVVAQRIRDLDYKAYGNTSTSFGLGGTGFGDKKPATQSQSGGIYNPEEPTPSSMPAPRFK
jgi:hypothetical protein